MNWYRLHQTAMVMPDANPLLMFLSVMWVVASVGTIVAGQVWWERRGEDFIRYLMIWMAAIAVSEYLVRLMAGSAMTAMVIR